MISSIFNIFYVHPFPFFHISILTLLKVEELQMKMRILNFRKFKQVVSIILFPFALNFGGKQEISQNQSYTA